MRTLRKCALCDNETDLELSHVVPKMAVRQLKKTSPGAIRNTENPNVPVQDSEKHYMLCADCEDKFSELETHFARMVFHPYLKGETDTFSYDENLARFITSVNWRNTYLDILDYAENGVEDIEVMNCLIDGERIMKEYLLGERKDLGHIENHIFFFDEIESFRGKTKDEIQSLKPHASIHRSITSYTFSCNSVATCGAITNMLGIVLITLFRKNPSDRWENTLVVNGNGVIVAKKQNVKSDVCHELIYIMERTKAAHESMSYTQQEKVTERLNKVGSEIKDFAVYKDWESDFNIEVDE